MTPIFHNSSAIHRMCGIISGARKNGHTCDLLTLRADKKDFAYDDSRKEFLKENIDHYYTIKKTFLYDRLSAKKQSDAKGERSAGSMSKRRSGYRRYIKNIIRNIFELLFVYDLQCMNSKQVIKLELDYTKYDKIISISDPKSSHDIVFKLLKYKKISNIDSKWIQYWGDPWLNDVMREGLRWKKLIRYKEKRLLRHACRIVYTNPFTLDAQIKEYPAYSSKMMYINQTADVQEKKTEILESNKRYIGYFGDYGSNFRNIQPLYRYCIKNNIHLYIAGRSSDYLVETETVKIKGRLSQRDVSRMEDEASVLISICNKNGTQIPGKVFYQAGYQKPMIIILDGEFKEKMRAYFDSFDRYILCENNEESISKAIDKAFKEIKTGKRYRLDKRLTEKYGAEKILE
jgi:hypothetical protein